MPSKWQLDTGTAAKRWLPPQPAKTGILAPDRSPRQGASTVAESSALPPLWVAWGLYRLVDCPGHSDWCFVPVRDWMPGRFAVVWIPDGCRSLSDFRPDRNRC